MHNEKQWQEIKIEKGIPVPVTGYLNWVKLAEKMLVGDSVFVRSDSERNNLRHAGKRRKQSFLSRREKDGYRMWRIK